MSDAAYFEGLGAALARHGVCHPVVVVDLARFGANLAEARRLIPAGLAARIVAKSLPAPELIRRACSALGTRALMTFSDDMLVRLLDEMPGMTHLMGKPLPVTAARRVLAERPEAAEAVDWLIDTEQRMDQYGALARDMGLELRVSLEIDVGLHRGGFAPDRLGALPDGLPLRITGVMGYEPHLAKLPGWLAGRERARVDAALEAGAGFARTQCAVPVINSGGSLTFSRYAGHPAVSEVSLGSVLVKPSDFDIEATESFQPAAFVATPVLKYMPGNPLPALGNFRSWLGRGHQAQIAVWGGYWKGAPVHPEGYKVSRAFGHSSNQEVWSGPVLDSNPVDGFAFLRPSQSEAVLAELGPIAGIGADGSLVWLDTIPPGREI